MENHLHWIASGPQLSKRVHEFKSFTATTTFKLMKKLGCDTMMQEFRFYKSRHKADQTHQLWQEGSHPKQITSDEMFGQKIEYIHNNPVRRGYVDDPSHWRRSSARIYAGKPGLLEICTDW